MLLLKGFFFFYFSCCLSKAGYYWEDIHLCFLTMLYYNSYNFVSLLFSIPLNFSITFYFNFIFYFSLLLLQLFPFSLYFLSAHNMARIQTSLTLVKEI